MMTPDDLTIPVQSPDAQFTACLRGYRRRLVRLVDERMICRGLFIAGVLAVVVLLVDLCTTWYVEPWHLLGLLLLGAMTGFITARLRTISDFSVALTLDRHLDLKERVSTAVALNGAEEQADFHALIVADAAAQLMGRTPAHDFPRAFSRQHQLTLAAWALVLLLYFLPDIPWPYAMPVRAERLAMQEAGTRLQEQAQAIRKHPELGKRKEIQRVAQRMQRTGAAMAHHRISKKEALKRMNAMKAELERAEKELAGKEGHSLADQTRQMLRNRSAEERKLADEARRQLANGKSPEQISRTAREALEREQALQALARQLNTGNATAAQQTLAQMQQQLQTQQLTAAQQQALAKALQQMEPGIAQMQAMQGTMQQAQQQTADAKAQLGNAQLAQNGNHGQQPGAGQPSEQPGGQQPGAGLPGAGQPGNQPGDQQGNMPGQPGGSQGRGPGMNNHNYNPTPLTRGTRTVEGRRAGGMLDTRNPATAIDLRGEPGQTGASRVPYADAYAGYRSRAESAVTTENIPPDERRRVKDYFQALDPAKQ